jgi:RHS repeat-associated protein
VFSAPKQSALAPELLPLGARSRLTGEPHQGHQLSTAALHPGIGFAISNTASGLWFPLYDFRGGPLRSGYFRDAETGLDYAMNRFHNPGTGRFMMPDPYMNSAGPTDPGSWNRYAYTRGDPVNRIDPNGTCDEYVDGYDSDCVPALDASAFFSSDCDASCQEAITFGGIIQAKLGGQDCSQVTYSGFQGLSPVALPGCGSSQSASTDPPEQLSCDLILNDDISEFLASYDGGASPLNTPGNIQALEDAGMSDDVDPRFIVALSVAESSAGTHLTWGPYNAWNIRVRNPAYNGPHKQPEYTSWTQAIDGVTGLIAGRQYFGSGLTTTGTIYPTYQGKGYQKGLKNLNTALGEMFGNQNLLTDPCNAKNLRDPNQ